MEWDGEREEEALEALRRMELVALERVVMVLMASS
jgi:hypothetical protein